MSPDPNDDMGSGAKREAGAAWRRFSAKVRRDLHRLLNVGVFHVLVVVIGIRGMSFFQHIALARILEPGTLGLAVYIVRLVAMLSIVAPLGLPTSVLKFVAEPVSEERRRAIFRTAMLFGGLSGVVCGVLYAISILLIDVLGPGLELRDELLFMALLLPIAGLEKMQPLLLQALKRIKQASKLNMVTNVIRLGLVIAGAYFFGLWGFLMAVIAGRLVHISLFLRVTGKFLWRARASLNLFRSMLGFGFYTLLGNFAGQANAAAGIFLLKWLGMSNETVAVFGVGTFVVMAVRIVPVAVRQTAFPYLSQLLADPGRFRRRVRELAAKQLIAVGLVSASIAASGPWLLPLVFGSPYERSAAPTALLLAALVFWSLRAPYGTSLVILNRVKLNFVMSGANLAALVGLGVLLIPRWGAMGAATAELTTTAAFSIPWFLLGEAELNRRCRSNRSADASGG